jgi:hypothetical protein
MNSEINFTRADGRAKVKKVTKIVVIKSIEATTPIS